MHHECDVIGLGAYRNVKVQRTPPSQGEETSLGFTPGLQFYDLETICLRNSTRWGMHVSLDQQRLNT
jgi:hypothetical protein